MYVYIYIYMYTYVYICIYIIHIDITINQERWPADFWFSWRVNDATGGANAPGTEWKVVPQGQAPRNELSCSTTGASKQQREKHWQKLSWKIGTARCWPKESRPHITHPTGLGHFKQTWHVFCCIAARGSWICLHPWAQLERANVEHCWQGWLSEPHGGEGSWPMDRFHRPSTIIFLSLLGCILNLKILKVQWLH